MSDTPKVDISAEALEKLEADRRGVFGCIGLRDQGFLCEDFGLGRERWCPVCKFAEVAFTLQAALAEAQESARLNALMAGKAREALAEAQEELRQITNVNETAQEAFDRSLSRALRAEAELRRLREAYVGLSQLVLDLQAHAKEAGWQDEDEPITALLE